MNIVTPGSYPPRRLPKAAAHMPRRAQQVVTMMVYGVDNSGPMNRAAIAAHLKLREDTIYRYESSPQARAFYRQLCREQREATVPANTVALVAIRDDPSRTAAMARAKTEAIKVLETGLDHAQPSHGAAGVPRIVVPGIVVKVMVGNEGRPPIDDTIIQVNGALPGSDDAST